jgi:hypothetical protein
MHDAAIAALTSAWTAMQSRPRSPHDLQWDFRANLRVSPLLRPLHGDPRFQAVVQHEGFPSGDRYAATDRGSD